jgi:hypothetical protein
MECRLQDRIKIVVETLAREHYQELAAAGTLVDLEELTCQIGDEVARLLSQHELARRGHEHASQAAECPDCGRSYLPDADPEPVVLAGARGELAFNQPKHYCDRCRRSFFPDGRPFGRARSQHGDDQGFAKGGVGRGEQ